MGQNRLAYHTIFAVCARNYDITSYAVMKDRIVQVARRLSLEDKIMLLMEVA